MSGRGRRAGFTLIELLLVIIILAAIAGAAVATLETATGDARIRDEDTRNRLERVRTAILGPDGATTPQGFVADVGRLPQSLAELVAPAVVPPGWRGPYLRTLPGPTGALDFPDGWGAPDALDGNFGWSLAPVISETFPLQSFGQGHVAGPFPADDPYAVDVPAAGTPLVGSSDWLIPVAGKAMNVEVVSAAPHSNVDVVLAIVFSDGGAAPIVVEAGALTGQTVSTSGPNTFSVVFAPLEDTRIPIGRRQLRVQLRTGASVEAEGRRDVLLLPRGDLPADIRVVVQ